MLITLRERWIEVHKGPGGFGSSGVWCERGEELQPNIIIIQDWWSLGNEARKMHTF